MNEAILEPIFHNINCRRSRKQEILNFNYLGIWVAEMGNPGVVKQQPSLVFYFANICCSIHSEIQLLLKINLCQISFSGFPKLSVTLSIAFFKKK